jgi:quercetin dioxygenase-like cupin family protein
MHKQQPTETIPNGFSPLVPIPQEEMPPGLYKLVSEYIQLSTQSELSDADSKRLIEISALAEYDDDLSDWLARIDDNEELILMSQKSQKKPFGLEDFILEVKRTSPTEMTLEKFISLAQKVVLSDDFLAEHIKFSDHDRSLTVISSTPFGQIYIIAWKPGQGCHAHFHDNSLGAIHVLEGELTHYLCEIPPHDNSGAYRRIKTDKIQAGDWIGIDLNQMHELANESRENVITLHFRFFKSPVVSENFGDDYSNKEPQTAGNPGVNKLHKQVEALQCKASVVSKDFLQKSGTGNREQGTEADKTEHLQEVLSMRIVSMRVDRQTSCGS